jgi:hypothetical protein
MVLRLAAAATTLLARIVFPWRIQPQLTPQLPYVQLDVGLLGSLPVIAADVDEGQVSQHKTNRAVLRVIAHFVKHLRLLLLHCCQQHGLAKF